MGILNEKRCNIYIYIPSLYKIDYLENKSNIEMIEIVENIEKYLTSNNYENAFYLFLRNISNLNYQNKDELILYFKIFFMKKYSMSTT